MSIKSQNGFVTVALTLVALLGITVIISTLLATRSSEGTLFNITIGTMIIASIGILILVLFLSLSAFKWLLSYKPRSAVGKEFRNMNKEIAFHIFLSMIIILVVLKLLPSSYASNNDYYKLVSVVVVYYIISFSGYHLSIKKGYSGLISLLNAIPLIGTLLFILLPNKKR